MDVALLSSPYVSLEYINPSDVSHSGLDILYVELVLECDREAVEWTSRLIVLGHILIKLMRVL